MSTTKLMMFDPGHFHASLLLREMYPDVASTVSIFCPLGADLLGHLARVAAFNGRPESPTSWSLDVYAGAETFERMLRERPGNCVVFSGRSSGKIEKVLASVRADLNVLVDKPWILNSEELPAIETVLDEADTRNVVAYDMMTERFEITTILQRAMVNDHAVFGDLLRGSPSDPGIYMESIHFLLKWVAGSPLARPEWFFDTDEKGEGLTDIGTHLVDLAQWTAFPNRAIDYKRDIEILAAEHWPTEITEADFQRVTGSRRFPAKLLARVKGGKLDFFCNTRVCYTLRGVHTVLNVVWDWESTGGSDTHFAAYKGVLSRVEVRQTEADRFKPEVYIVPNQLSDKPRILEAIEARLQALQRSYPGVGVEDLGSELRLKVPDTFRVGHEAHFAQVAAHFLRYIKDPSAMPAWERPNMLAKYFVTTKGAELSRESPVKVAPRLAPR